MSIDIVLFHPHNNPLKNNNLVVPLNFLMIATGVHINKLSGESGSWCQRRMLRKSNTAPATVMSLFLNY